MVRQSPLRRDVSECRGINVTARVAGGCKGYRTVRCRNRQSSLVNNVGAAADISLELWALRQELVYFEKVFQVSCAVVEAPSGMDSSELMSSLDSVVST